MSDTNRVRLGIVEESTFGTTPATPAFETLRVTSANPAFTPTTTISNEMRADRQVADLILVGAEAGGPVGFEVSHGALDTPIEGAMFSDWVSKPNRYNATSDSDISDVDAASDTYTVANGTAFLEGALIRATGFTESGNNGLFRAESGSGATAVVVPASPGLTDEAAPPAGARLRSVGFEGEAGDIDAVISGGNALVSNNLDFTDFLVPGEWLYIGGSAVGNKFPDAGSNGWARVAADGVAQNRVDLDIVPAGWGASDGSGIELQVFTGDYIRNGVVEHSYSLERAFLDHSPITYEYLTGMEFDSLSISVESESIITAEASLVGKSATMQDSARFTGATTVEAPAGDVLNSSSNVGRLGENGTLVAGPNFVMSASINFANNLRRRTAVGSLGAVSIGAGECAVTGTLNTYFGNKTIADKVINNTASSYDLIVGRSDGEKPAMVIDLPRLKFSSGSPTVPGKNQDVMLDAQFTAFRHPDFGYTAQIQRFHYLP